ncbi:MAG: molybdenum cofactor guanylyltransferase [Dehalococcoidia bacterium]
MTAGLAGIVLAGGQSRRFGSDKASALLAGRSLLDWVTSATGRVCDSVVVVRARGQVLPLIREGTMVVDDFADAEGPLAGLIAGLRACRTEWAFATSCDAPLLRPGVIELLARRAAGHGGAIAEVDGFRQPLVAVYRVSDTLQALEASFAEGNRALTRAIAALGLAIVSEGELRAVDPGLVSFLNANRPGTLAGMGRILADLGESDS